MANPNLELLASVARLLGPMLEDLVFVGGCTTALLITDPAAAEVRPTYDVDCIAEIASYPEYAAFSERLRRLGFAEDPSDDAPTCRWIHGKIRLDVMPTDEKVLGFSNRWYKSAMEDAQSMELEEGLVIRVITAPLFLGTKLEAFKGRGKDDYFSSHDLEDLIAVIDGRPSLPDEIQRVPGWSEGLYRSADAEVARGQRVYGRSARISPCPMLRVRRGWDLCCRR